MRASTPIFVSLSFALVTTAAAAQTAPAVSDLPPTLPAADAPMPAVPAAAATPAATRKAIDLPAARPAAEASSTSKTDEGLVPTEAEMAAARARPSKPADPETRIVEVVRGKQVVEVVVTPGLTQRSYVMENRPERAAAPGSESGTLSVPRFLRLDF